MSRNKNEVDVFITGPSRTGTTFLATLFHRMGFDLRFSDIEVDKCQLKPAPGGLEYLRSTRFLYGQGGAKSKGNLDMYYPEVVKHPLGVLTQKYGPFSQLDKREIKVKNIIITMREFGAIAKSNTDFQISREKWKEEHRQEFIDRIANKLPAKVGSFINQAMGRGVDVTLIEFPKMVQDKEFLFRKLQFIPKVTSEKFDVAFDTTSDSSKVLF